MRISFYDTRLSENYKTILIKEKAVNYEAGNMNNPKKVTAMLQDLLHMSELAEEYCYMIALNSACKILGVCFLSKGTANTNLVSPREVYLRAIFLGATYIILCHNHPSGNVTPSDHDFKLTERIKEAGNLLDIRLSDHIIVGGDEYFSFAEMVQKCRHFGTFKKRVPKTRYQISS